MNFNGGLRGFEDSAGYWQPNLFWDAMFLGIKLAGEVATPVDCLEVQANFGIP